MQRARLVGWQGCQRVRERDQRSAARSFLALLSNREIGRIVVKHQDRAFRFGVAYIQTLLTLQERELVIVNTADTEESDLMGDFVAIITLLCCPALRAQAC